MTFRQEIDARDPASPPNLRPLYRISHQASIRPYLVAYPMGIHLVVRWVKRIYEWSFRYNPSDFEGLQSRIYDHGYWMGFRDAEVQTAEENVRESGFTEGLKAGRREMTLRFYDNMRAHSAMFTEREKRQMLEMDQENKGG